ncbi:MAG TPA: hypothetical protein VMT89_09240, partial [Candidatus Acidoferrales bacterium]|nr:hypothetical protein [Candidatus Acidoferrales bacterium]
MFRSLRSQLIAIVVGTVAAVLAVSQWLDTRLSEKALEEDTRSRAQLVLRAVGARWGRVDEPTLQRELDAIVQGDRDIVGLEVFRFAGNAAKPEIRASESGTSSEEALTDDQVVALQRGQATTAL